MSKSSFSHVNFALRPAKNIERKMLGECYARLGSICPLRDYQYVGFGSPFFNDFSLYHQALGITRMVSIEKRDTDLNRDRFKFNRPFGCIQLKWGQAASVIPKLDWAHRTIVWLDYDTRLRDSEISDISAVASFVESGSVVAVTVNAQPSARADDEGKHANVHQQRRAELDADLNNKWVPTGTKGAHLAGWGLAKVYRKAILAAVSDTLAERNAPLPESDRLTFSQFAFFTYSDNPKMVTVAGAVLNAADQEHLGDNWLDGLDFAREGETECRLEPPVLTGREVRALNQLLPVKAGTSPKPPKWLSTTQLEKYADVYKYFPTFSESEL